MSNFIPFDTPGGLIWIQVEEEIDGGVLVNAFQNTTFDSFDEVVAALMQNAQILQTKLSDLQPTYLEISFGIKASIKPGIVPTPNTRIFALAKGSDDANYCIKVRWEDKDNEG